MMEKKTSTVRKSSSGVNVIEKRDEKERGRKRDAIPEEREEEQHAQSKDVITEESKEGREENAEEEKNARSPLIYIIALLLIFIMILWIVPGYAIKLDPEPRNIPSLKTVIPEPISINDKNTTVTEPAQFLLLVNPTDPLIRQTATRIVTASCPEMSRICSAKALFYFVRDNLDYVSDPEKEYIESPQEVLATGGADCDGLAILLLSLEEAIGINGRFVFIPEHVYIQLRLPDAPRKYQDEDGWISLDPACASCGFGEIPAENRDKPKSYLGG